MNRQKAFLFSKCTEGHFGVPDNWSRPKVIKIMPGRANREEMTRVSAIACPECHPWGGESRPFERDIEFVFPNGSKWYVDPPPSYPASTGVSPARGSANNADNSPPRGPANVYPGRWIYPFAATSQDMAEFGLFDDQIDDAGDGIDVFAPRTHGRRANGRPRSNAFTGGSRFRGPHARQDAISESSIVPANVRRLQELGGFQTMPPFQLSAPMRPLSPLPELPRLNHMAAGRINHGATGRLDRVDTSRLEHYAGMLPRALEQMAETPVGGPAQNWEEAIHYLNLAGEMSRAAQHRLEQIRLEQERREHRDVIRAQLDDIARHRAFVAARDTMPEATSTDPPEGNRVHARGPARDGTQEDVDRIVRMHSRSRSRGFWGRSRRRQN